MDGSELQAPTGGMRMIDGVLLHPLQRLPDERGVVMHMLRADDPHFESFSEIYFSIVYPGVVQGLAKPARPHDAQLRGD